jgi:hypothetical protein
LFQFCADGDLQGLAPRDLMQTIVEYPQSVQSRARDVFRGFGLENLDKRHLHQNLSLSVSNFKRIP